MADPTIVLASLDDEKLKQSIANLVAHVKRATHTMLTDTNSTVEAMEKKLKSLGNIKIDSGGSADGGSSKRTSKLKEEETQTKANTQAIKENTAAKKENLTFDQQQKGLQTAMGVKSARDSFYAFAQGYKKQAQEIAQYIQAFESGLNRVIQNRLNELNAQLSASKEKIRQLNEELNRRQFASGNPQAQAQVQAQLDKELKTHNQIQKAIANVNNEYAFEKTYLASLYAEHHRISNILRDETTTNNKVVQSQQEVAQSVQQTTQSAQRYTEEIRNQAAAIRATKEWQEKGRYRIGEASFYDPETSRLAKKDIISLEEQILQWKRKQTEETEKATRAEYQYSDAIKNAAGELRAHLHGARSSSINVGGQAIYRDLEDVTIERQLNSLVAERGKEFNLQKAVTEAIAADEKRISEELQKEVDNERKINSERQNRINTKSADFWSNAERENIVTILAQRNQIDRSRVKNWDEETSSIQTLSSALKQYQTAYQRLTAEQRSSTVGKQLVADMQVIERSIQKARAELSRPIDLESAMRLPQKTLDDIAYKMRQLTSYRSGLNVETQAKEIDQVNRKYAELQKKMNEVMAKNSQMASSNNILANSWRYMRNRLAFYLTVSTGTTLVRDLARVRSEYEMNEKALGTLLNSAERGTRIFNELSNMALMSPYTLIELSAAAKQLTAYDIAAKDVVDTTRRLADISAAVGIPVERLTYALGQVKAYGHLTSQDARQFLNAGVPLVKELANRYSELEGRLVSTADVYDRMKKHAISYNDVLSVLTSMTDEGGRFFDYQAKMAETLKVRLANLTLAYNNMLNDMGKANSGVFTTGIKGLTQLLKHWREIERILGTVVVGIGAYRAATLLAGITTTTAIGKNAFGAWISLARGVKSAKDATALFSLTIKSIPFAGWATAIASLVSYFVLFNNSADETKQKLQDIATAFEGIRKETTDLFADAISTDSIGTQLMKLKDVLELAETELGITIPINLEDVNDSNIKQKLRDAKNTIDNYVNFSQTFSEAAVDTRFNESMIDFGTTARSTYTSITESINTVKVALQELVDAGKASKRDIEILKELDNKPKDGESRIEYFQRLVKLYEELGLLGQKKTTPTISPFSSSENNMKELIQKQETSLDRLEIKNKTVFETMLTDVQDYYSKSSIAAYQFEEQVERVAKSVDIFNKDIPIEERTAKLEVAINQEAAKNNWNEFAIQYAKWVANQKFGLNIAISEESKKDSEIELSGWQKRMQAWADKNGIKFSLNFIEKEDEKAYADRMLQAAKDAQGKLDVQRRKLDVGTGSQSAVDNATKDYNEARILALKAGADLSSLDKKRNKERKQTESELQKALKDELSTIDKVRSIYKDLTKEGMSHANAVERATRGWDETVNAINRVLQKNGLQKLDLSKFAGIENPRELVNMLQSQLNTLLKRGAKPAEIKELQTKIQTLNVDAEKYDLTKITKGLNNELGKLKDEYELALELDANPEMGNMFADFMGINIDELPRTFQEAARRAQKGIDKVFAENNRTDKIDIASMLNRESFDKWVEDSGLKMDSELVKSVEAFRQYLYKTQVDEAKKQIDEWNKLLEKYAEYEYKKKQIRKQYERELETARKKGADENIVAAITNRYNQENAKLDFEQFQTTPQWITATGDLAGLTHKALGMLIDDLIEYKKNAKNLNPKQIKEINRALRSLYKEQRNNNPFLSLSNAMDEAADRASVFQEEIDNSNKELLKLENNRSQENIADIAEKIDELRKKIKKLNEEKDKAKKVDVSVYTEWFNSIISLASNAADSISDMMNALAGENGGGDAKSIKDMFDILGNAGQWAAVGAQLGGAYGAVIGGAFGAITSVVTKFADEWSGNADITDKVKESERAVKRLELAYVDLEHAMKKAYGTSEIGAKKAVVFNKELQRQELQRQLKLEESRKAKNKDYDKILDLKKQIKELEYDIIDSINEITYSLLGITSVGSAAETLVSSMIAAFKKGERFMDEYKQSFDDMIDNMIMKSIVSNVIGQRLQDMFDRIQKTAEDRASSEKEAYEKAAKDYEQWLKFADNKWFEEYYYFDPKTFNVDRTKVITREEQEKLWKERLEYLLKQYENALTPTTEDVQSIRNDMDNWREGVKEEFLAYMDAFGVKYGQDSAASLSSLQQGIQGVSEETAGALEAYMNGVSQQVYLHSDLLTQIRDAVVGFDIDVQTASLSQILLQLQTNYIVMQSMHSMMEGWTTPSGSGIRVELIS